MFPLSTKWLLRAEFTASIDLDHDFSPFFWAIKYLQKGQKKGEKSWGGDVKKLFRLAVVRASCVAMLLKPTERRLRAEFTQSKHPHHKFSPFFYFFLEQNFKKVQEKGAKSWTGDDKKLFQLTVMIETSLAIFFQITERCFRAEFIASTHLHHDFYPFFWEIQIWPQMGSKTEKKGVKLCSEDVNKAIWNDCGEIILCVNIFSKHTKALESSIHREYTSWPWFLPFFLSSQAFSRKKKKSLFAN